MSKGIVWVPIAIAIFLIAELLIVSLAFNKISTFERQLREADISFESQIVDNYQISINNAVDLSTIQSIYDFYLENIDKSWQSGGTSNVPSVSEVSSYLETKINGYMSGFHSQYTTFDNGFLRPGTSLFFPENIGNADVTVMSSQDVVETRMSPYTIRSDKTIEIAKTFEPTAIVHNYFGKIYDFSSGFVSRDDLGSGIVKAISSLNFDKSGSRSSCGSAPSANSVFSGINGMSMETAESRMESEINNELDSMAEGYSNTVYTVSFPEPKRSIQTDVIPSCSTHVTGGCGIGFLTPVYTTTCSFDFEGDVRASVDVIADGGYKYALFDGTRTVEDYIRLSFIADSSEVV